MPSSAAGSLTVPDCLSVLAFLLEQNGAQVGNEVLTDDDSLLSAIKVDAGATATKPAPVQSSDEFIIGPHGLLPTGLGPSQKELLAAIQQGRDWLTSNRDYSGDRTSPLTEINHTNISQLHEVCSYNLNASTSFQTAPLVYEGMLYLTSASSTVAIDAATCKLHWRHDWPVVIPALDHVANRGLAIKDGRVIRGIADGHLLALDMKTGTLLWARRISDLSHGEMITMPPLIYDDLIIVAPAVGKFGIHGWISAFRLTDGQPVWRSNTVPKPGESDAETWSSNPPAPLGGGAVWTPLSLDLTHELLFVPTANPAPDFAVGLRGGNNLYTDGVLALHLRTGRLAWFHQVKPGDDHDWDVTQVSPLFGTTIRDKLHNAIASTGKNGILRVIDRDTQKELYQTALTTIRNTDLPVTEKGVDVCPGTFGGVEWNGPAFLPTANLLVTPSVDWCTTYKLTKNVKFEPFQMYLGGEDVMSGRATG